MFEHAQRSGCRKFSVQVLAPVVSNTVSHIEARRCCTEARRWTRRYRDPGKNVCLPEVGLQRSRCCAVKGTPAGYCMAQLGAILEIMSPTFSVCTVYLCSARGLFKDAARQTGAFSCLFSGYHNPKYKSLPAPTGFYVGQTKGWPAKPINYEDVTKQCHRCCLQGCVCVYVLLTQL